MKIGFDAKRLFHNNTGLGNYSRDLVRILKEFYPHYDLSLYNPKKKSIPYFSDKENFRIISPKGIWKKFNSIWRSYSISKEPSINSIDIFHGLSGELPFNLPKRIKKVVTIHDLIFVRYPHLYSFFDRKIHLKKFKYAAEKADIIVAISEQTKRDIIEFLHINPDKIKVIYQGCSNIFKQKFNSITLNATKDKYQLPEQFILNVGTIETRKNALNIVKAIKNIDTTLILIGKKTKYYDQIESFVEQHNLQHKVKHLQNVSQEELAHIYQLATIFVYPSVFEGFGIPIIESIFSGTPVITTNSGVFPEAGGPNSIYIDPENINEIENAIQSLLDNEELRKEISQKSEIFVNKFTDNEIAKQWNNLYQSL